MNQTKIFIDTNVLVYAHDELSIYHQDSVLLLEMALEGKFQGVIAEQNIIELYRVLTNPVAMSARALTPSQTKNLIDNTYLNGAFEIIYPTRLSIDIVLQLAVEKNITSAKIFDLRLAALILSLNVDYFATYNTNDFQNISGLNPLTPGQILTEIRE